MVLTGALVAAGIHHVYALMSFSLCFFVSWTILSEFYKGARAVGAKTGQNLALAAVELTHRNTRRDRWISHPHGHRADVHRIHG